MCVSVCVCVSMKTVATNKAASMSQILYFIGNEKLCALHLKSKYYTLDFVTFSSCGGLAVVN